MRAGPLKESRIIEFAGLGAAPMAAMMLADMGADVIRIDRPGPTLMDQWPKEFDVCARNRTSISLDLKKPEGIELALRLIETADGLIEGFRPGVAERLGFGPDVCLARNPRLVYGRMTGWGQEGPLAHHAGHDINYIALTGALSAIGGEGQPPSIPLNLIGDGGGAMLMAFGMVSGFYEALRSGQGQVVDVAMVDAAALLYAPGFAFEAARDPASPRGTREGNGGAPYYNVYETADGKYVSVGAIEPQFYARLTEGMGFASGELPDRTKKSNWPVVKVIFAKRFATKTRAEWNAILGSSETCYAPVLSAREALEHPHALARQSYRNIDGVNQPAPAPRFSRSNATETTVPALPGADTNELLRQLGLGDDEIAALQRNATIV